MQRDLDSKAKMDLMFSKAIEEAASTSNTADIPLDPPSVARALRSDPVDYTEQDARSDDEEDYIYLEESTAEEYLGITDIDAAVIASTAEVDPFLAAVCPANKRIAIAYVFETVFGNPPKALWAEKRIVWKISEMFQDRRVAFKNTVVKVLNTLIECQKTGVPYAGAGNYAACGRKPLIDLESVEAEIVADSFEGGQTLDFATYNVNTHRESKGLPSLTSSAVYGCFRRMKPQVKKIKRGKQGSKDKESPWSRASFRWVCQLLLRFGKIDFKHKSFSVLLGASYDVEHPPSPYDMTLLPLLDVTKVVFWDEMHRKCVIGDQSSRVGSGKSNFVVSFKRDKAGKLDLVNGEYPVADKSILKVKYESEIRMAFGVNKTHNEKGTGFIGRKLEPYDYTEKTIITRPSRHKLRLQEIALVKGGKGKYW